MKQYILVLIFLVLLLGILVGLNAVSYTKLEQKPDSEYNPNRSSYNSGTTGTSAFYALLAETGNKVTRWQQPPSALLSPAGSKIRTLVLIGTPRKFVSDEEAAKILLWVSKGNRLVLIDRFPHADLLKTESNWKLAPISSVSGTEPSHANIDLSNTALLTDKIAAAKPVQPTSLMKGITAVQPSVLASSIKLEYSDKPETEEKGLFKLGSIEGPPPPTPKTNKLTGQPAGNKSEKIRQETPVLTTSSTPLPSSGTGSGGISGPAASDLSVVKNAATPVAPVIHLANTEKDILADYPYGQGRIVFLSDPFIVSNAGIKLVDNATLAVNLVAMDKGTIAFDEFHQGFGAENTFFRYFAGTPVLALLGQAILLVFVLVWTQGRRFARPLPAPAKDRRSKLEYVAAMADLQQSTRAYDLAIENVYTQTKRNMVRLVGADNTATKRQLAEAVAQRTGLEAKNLFKIMAKCEDIIHGEPTNAKETMNLISELRALEEKLGFYRSRGAGMK